MTVTISLAPEALDRVITEVRANPMPDRTDSMLLCELFRSASEHDLWAMESTRSPDAWISIEPFVPAMPDVIEVQAATAQLRVILPGVALEVSTDALHGWPTDRLDELLPACASYLTEQINASLTAAAALAPIL